MRTVEQARRPFTYKVTYAVPDSHPLVSIIIPTKDHANILDNCITSIVEKSTYDNYRACHNRKQQHGKGRRSITTISCRQNILISFVL